MLGAMEPQDLQPASPPPPPPASSLPRGPGLQPDTPPPPPPAPEHVPPTHGQLVLLLGYLGAGMLLVLLAGVLQRGASAASWTLGLFLCCHAVIVAASWLPPQLSSRRLDSWLDRWVKDVGGGFYGLMAVSTFVGRELASLYDDIVGFDLSLGSIASALVPWLIGFSIDSLMNSLMAIIWPVALLDHLSVTAALVVVGIAWGLFALGAKVFPQPAFMIAKKPPRERKPDAGG